MKSFSFPLVLALLIAIVAYLAIMNVTKYTSVHCTISEVSATYSANPARVETYYSAVNGAYVKYGSSLSSIPDMYEWPLSFDYNKFVAFLHAKWEVLEKDQFKYENSNFKEEMYIDRPPANVASWQSYGASMKVNKVSCAGSLQDSRNDDSFYENQDDNIQMLRNRPVTTFFLLVIFAIFYFIQTGQFDQEKLVYSYHSVVNNGEYFRIWTSSLSHFDYLHILFNAMGFYSFSILEYMLGSVTYFAYTFYLIPLTILIVMLIQYVMIHKFNHENQINQTAVGFSCVLFAYIVTISILKDEYCPIFLFPTFCFKTYHFGGAYNISFNLGPFVLLVITKLIIPRSSFIGHFAGMLIGYPLAWGFFKYVTPLGFFSFMTLLVLFREKYVFSYSNLLAVVQNSNALATLESANNLEFDSEHRRRERDEAAFTSTNFKSTSKLFLILASSYILITLYYLSLTQMSIRLLILYIMATTFVKLRHTIMFDVPNIPPPQSFSPSNDNSVMNESGNNNNSGSSNNNSNQLCSMLITLLVLLTFISMYDVYNLIGLISANSVLQSYYKQGLVSLVVFYICQSISLIAEIAFIIKIVQVMLSIAKSNYLTSATFNLDTITVVRQWAEFLRISNEDVNSDLKLIKDFFWGICEYVISTFKSLITFLSQYFKCNNYFNCFNRSDQPSALNSSSAATTNTNSGMDANSDEVGESSGCCLSRFFNNFQVGTTRSLGNDRSSSSAAGGGGSVVSGGIEYSRIDVKGDDGFASSDS